MDNGNTREVISQFDRIALLPDVPWDHNLRYHPFLLRRIPKNARIGLDIGCGAGLFTYRLSESCFQAIGIDVSENMIREAKQRHGRENIEYSRISADIFFANTPVKFDVIVSIATLHHLDMEKTFKKAKQALAPNGRLIILDIFKERTVSDFLLSGISVIMNPLFYLLRRRRLSATPREKEAWKGHFQHDSYSTMKEIKECAARTLGDARIKRHLFWRYSLVYEKERS